MDYVIIRRHGLSMTACDLNPVRHQSLSKAASPFASKTTPPTATTRPAHNGITGSKLVLIPVAKSATPTITIITFRLLVVLASTLFLTKGSAGFAAAAGFLRSWGLRSPTHSTHCLSSRSKHVRHTSRPQALHLNMDSFLTITPREQIWQKTWTTSWMTLSTPLSSFQYLAATGIRRPEPKAFPVTLRPGAACFLLCSLALTARTTHSTVFLLNPLLMIAPGSIRSST